MFVLCEEPIIAISLIQCCTFVLHGALPHLKRVVVFFHFEVKMHCFFFFAWLYWMKPYQA